MRTDKPLHIGILSLPSNFHCEKWARALARAGARVTVFSFEEGEIAGPEGVRCVQLRAPLVWRGRYRYPSYWLARHELRRALIAHQVDVLHPLHLTPFGSWAVWSGFRPIIAAAMGADVLEYPPDAEHLQGGSVRTWRQAEVQQSAVQKLRARLLNRFYRARVQEVVRRADLLTGDNMPLVDALRNWFGAAPEKARLLRWGLEPELLDAEEATRTAVRAEYNIAPGARVVLSPRGANALYQADIIVESIEELLRSGPAGYHYILLGAGYDAAAPVLQRAQRLAAQHANFTFTPQQLQRLQVYRLWSIVDIFISAPIYDGYSAAVAEGRYVGAIPVVNDIPGNTEIIAHLENGIIVSPFASQQLTSAMLDVYQNYEAYKARFAVKNRAWILEHSVLQKNAAQLVSWAAEVFQQYNAKKA